MRLHRSSTFEPLVGSGRCAILRADLSVETGDEAMSYIDELAYDEEEPVVVDKTHVERRVDDWLQRLNSLYADISAWADRNGWLHVEGAPVAMDEELMQRAGLAPREQASLVLTAPGGERVWFKPKGLWVIGANGRVDVYTLKELLLLVDTARQFESPQWVIHYLPSRAGGGQPFTPPMLSQLA